MRRFKDTIITEQIRRVEILCYIMLGAVFICALIALGIKMFEYNNKEHNNKKTSKRSSRKIKKEQKNNPQ